MKYFQTRIAIHLKSAEKYFSQVLFIAQFIVFSHRLPGAAQVAIQFKIVLRLGPSLNF